MTDLVPAEQIEKIVGALRHSLAHLGRAVSSEQTVYILHSHACKDSGIDLRSCGYSRALDNGIDTADWQNHQDRTVTLQHAHGFLMPDDDGPDDIELLPTSPMTTEHGETEPCPRCGDTSCDGKVTQRADPYLVEIHDETVMRFYCDGEFAQRKDET